MTDNTPPFYPAYATTIPVFHWRGIRPFLLDLLADNIGSAVLLVLGREGDCCLLPITWEQNSIFESDSPSPFTPRSSPFFHADALDSEAFHLTLSDLQRDGWQVNGRLDIRFTGQFTDDNFWQTIHSCLWHNDQNK
jgi:hypothetical protein